MCFKVQKSYGVVAKIAKNPIYCFKVLKETKKSISSPIRSFNWKNDVEYIEEDFKTRPNPYNEVNLGFHMHASIEEATDFMKGRPKSYKIFLMEIPKGAKYFVNNKQYCSNRVILRGKTDF